MVPLAVLRLEQVKSAQSRLQLKGQCIGIPVALQQWQLTKRFLWHLEACLSVGQQVVVGALRRDTG